MLKRLVLAALLCAGAAHAQTWTMQYSGTFIYSSGSCQPDCLPPLISPWHPVITFETVSAADGSYAGSFIGPPIDPSDPPNTLTRVVMVDDFPLAGVASFDTSSPAFGTSHFGNFTATILGGHVASFAGFVLGPVDAHWSISLESVTFDLFTGGTSFGGFATAATAAVVPEPSTYALLLGGLGVLGAAAHRRKVK